MLTVPVVHTCLLLNATTLLILIGVVSTVIVMMLLSTAVSLWDNKCKINKFTIIYCTSYGKLVIGSGEMHLEYFNRYNCIHCLLYRIGDIFFHGYIVCEFWILEKLYTENIKFIWLTFHF